MSRRHFSFDCGGAELVGTVDGTGPVGVLMVSGGNEVRAGAWNGQAILAARLAQAGLAAMRFDRRGVGDSGGENRGFRGQAEDIGAALAAFRREVPGMTKVFALGNCDAASALMLGRGCGMDGLVLSNPWTFDEVAGDEGEAPAPPAALRAHYWRRMRDPAAVMRLLRGRVSMSGLLGSLRGMAAPVRASGLAQEIAKGLAGFGGPVAILLAGRDRTAQAFLAQWPKGDARMAVCAGASHSFVEDDAREWLVERILGAVARVPEGPSTGSS